LTSIWSIGTSTRVSTSVGSEAKSAPKPRPSPRLVIMVQHLPRQFEIGHGATGPEIVEHDRSAVARRFRETDVARNDGVEYLPREVSVHLGADLEREARAAIEHREQESQEIEARAQSVPEHLHRRRGPLRQPLER